MFNLSKYKVEKGIIIPVILFSIISIVTIYSAQNLLGKNYLALKQFIWYIVGFIVAFLIMIIGNEKIVKKTWILYVMGNLSLLALLIFAHPINDSKCWFTIKGIGTIQPSEFMKIILIITLSYMIDNFNKRYPNPTILEEFKFLVKVAIIVLIPSFLTFLQPDTGVVLIYILIATIMLFIAGIKYRWFIILFLLFFLTIGTVMIVYFVSQDLFIKLFGTSFFLRVDRLLDWSNKSGYQLENAMVSIGSAGRFGHGFNNTPLYFPEAHTDFIFAIYSSNFGLIGSILLIILITYFDIRLIVLALKIDNKQYKYMISGIIGMIFYQQIQNIGMTFGLLPITGITLPFISYGGSSLISYMIMIGIVFNISNSVLKKEKITE